MYPLSLAEEKEEQKLEIGPEVYDYTDIDLDIDFPSNKKANEE